VLLAVLALVVGAAGCGSGSSGTTGGTGGTAAAPRAGRAGAAGGRHGSGAAGKGNSIEGYGSEAGGAARRGVAVATHSFLTAIATHGYARVCAGLTASNRRQLAEFARLKGDGAKGCAEGVSRLLAPAAAKEAEKSAEARIDKVRIKGGTAFALFRPPGGVPSYFVMKKEAGAWKAISLSTGTPVIPTVGP